MHIIIIIKYIIKFTYKVLDKYTYNDVPRQFAYIINYSIININEMII